MKNINNILKEIEEEVILLKDIDDCFGLEIGENKGLFIQVIDYGEGMEYLIEFNNIDSNGCYEPCADYNAFSEFGNIEELNKSIKEYLFLQNLN